MNDPKRHFVIGTADLSKLPENIDLSQAARDVVVQLLNQCAHSSGSNVVIHDVTFCPIGENKLLVGVIAEEIGIAIVRGPMSIN